MTYIEHWKISTKKKKYLKSYQHPLNINIGRKLRSYVLLIIMFVNKKVTPSHRHVKRKRFYINGIYI